MDKNELEIFENRKQKEKIVLLILTVYSFGMLMVSLILSWPVYIPPVICIGLFGSWMMCIRNYRDFRFRVNVLAIVSLIDFTMYAVRAGSLYDLLTPLAAVAVLLGITALPEILRWVNIDTIFLCYYHIFIRKTVPFFDSLDRCRAILVLASIALVEIVTYIVMKNQQRMLQQMQQIIDDLKIAENSKSDFLANVSHEIRTPINAVCGISEMMLMEELSPKVKEDVHDVQMAGRNLQRIISDLLDFTELQAGNISLIEEPYNLTSTVNDVMNMVDALIGTKKIELIVDCDVNIPRSLVGDEQKIRRVMVSILNNAAKFTMEGCIRLKITSRVEAYGINLIVSIEDTGIGIKEENLEKLFTNFNQVDTKKNRKEGGIGLGLAITKALVNKMGGFVTVESIYQKGTRVQFVIPQKVDDEHPMMEVNEIRKKRVISYVNLEKFQYALVREGYSELIQNMVNQLQMNYLSCRNLDEMKRRLKKENYTHIFIGWEEYEEDKIYFEEMAEHLPVVIIADREVFEEHMEELEKSSVYRVFKPFYALSIISALNGDESMIRTSETGKKVRFTAPEASVLVVDDSLMNLKVVEGLLRPYQIRVFTAESGAEEIEKIERGNFDFVFMDHMMPEMDGVETLRKIRSKAGNYFKNVPVIALTANAVGGAREMFLQEGFQDFVSKPIELPVLERILRKYIPESKKQKGIVINESENIQEEEFLNEELSGIDIKLGIQYSGGNEADYRDIVRIYCSSGRKKIKEIQDYYEKNDWKNYTILVHAVKSTSLGIGAKELSDMAKALENAGREENQEFIKKHHTNMVQLYELIMNEAEEKILLTEQKETEQKKESTEISREDLEPLLQNLTDALDSFEADTVKPVLMDITKFTCNEIDISAFTKDIQEKVENFDFIGAEEVVRKIKEEMR